MKAAVLIKENEITIMDLPVPTPGENQILVRNKVCLICNSTDTKFYTGKCSRVKYPCIRWNTFINVARDSELILLHENEKDIYGDTAERCLDILETMKCPYLKAVFDPANFVQCDLESYPESFAKQS